MYNMYVSVSQTIIFFFFRKFNTTTINETMAVSKKISLTILTILLVSYFYIILCIYMYINLNNFEINFFSIILYKKLMYFLSLYLQCTHNI